MFLRYITATVSICLAVLVSALFFVSLASPSLAETEGIESARSGLNQAADQFTNIKQNSDPRVVVGRLLNYLLSFVGTIFFVLMIYGGFTWMIARGNDTEVKKAKDIIETAIVGLLIIASAYAITSFIGGVAKGL